jgi:cytochrome c-type biogenesis protein CcmH
MSGPQNRREFLALAGRGAGALAAVVVASSATTRFLGAQQDSTVQSAASNVPMTADAYKPVRKPKKANATPQMDKAALETFERNIACPCPCTLDVYTCRTTDFNCGISPAVHGDIQMLIEGGYTADEIMAALRETYGDFILMAPRKEGFSLLAWFTPFAALGGGALAIGMLLRRWRRNASAASTAREAAAQRDSAVDGSGTDATPDELERLEAALRDGSQ